MKTWNFRQEELSEYQEFIRFYRILISLSTARLIKIAKE